MIVGNQTVILIIVGALGAAIGSWLNVVILRLQSNRPWWSGRSACPHCGTNLRWFELIPMVSYVLIGGRCRYCRRVLTRQYILVEIITAVSFMITYAHFYGGGMVIVAWLLVATMILIGVYDGRWSLIPDAFSIPFILVALVASFLQGQEIVTPLIGGLVGGLFFSAQHMLSGKRWVGSGDIFLGVGLGLLLGWRFLLVALFLAYLSGAFIAGIFILMKRLKLTSAMPFGPYLMAAGFVTWLWGQQILEWYFHHALFT